jgi:tryptophan synthase alpha chain
MPKSELITAFEKCKKEGRPSLLTYQVAGDPNKKKSFEILKSISKHATACEWGLSHSANIGDGKYIQDATFRVIRNKFKIKDAFGIIKKYKRDKQSKPIILMFYYNTLFQYGENRFIKKMKEIQATGCICVDYPYPQNKSFALKCKKNNITFIQLLSPNIETSLAKKIISNSHKIIYFISQLSTTGSKLKVSPKRILKNYNRIKRMARGKFIILGFGITEKTIAKFKKSDSIVVGSACCKAIANAIKKNHSPAIMLSKMIKRLKKKIL